MDLARSEAAWTIAAVSERTGISKAALRGWDIRYGLSPSGTTAGGHRRYSSADVEMLRAARQLVDQGVAAAEAARSVLAERAAPTLPLGAGSPAAAYRLATHAMRLDGPACAAALRHELGTTGVVQTWESVLRPVMRAVAERAQESALGVAVEHVVSHVATVTLAEKAPAVAHRPVLLACVPGEEHELPMVALAAALAESGHAATLIGARTPAEALTDAVRQTRPGVVVLFSLLGGDADVAALARETTVLAAGPGWRGTALPPGLAHVDGLAAAVAAVHRLV